MTVNLTVSGIKADLANGVTRLKSDKNYNPEIGSIEEKYGLPASEVRKLFKHPALQGLKVIPYKAPMWTLEDDTVPSTTTNVAEEASTTETSLEDSVETPQVGEALEETSAPSGTYF